MDRVHYETWGNYAGMSAISIDGDCFTPATRPLFRWNGRDYNDLAPVQKALGLERAGRIAQ